MIKDTDNMDVHGEDELTGGDSPIVATHCRDCGKEIESCMITCQECWDKRANEQENIAEDERLGW